MLHFQKRTFLPVHVVRACSASRHLEIIPEGESTTFLALYGPHGRGRTQLQARSRFGETPSILSRRFQQARSALAHFLARSKNADARKPDAVIQASPICFLALQASLCTLASNHHSSTPQPALQHSPTPSKMYTATLSSPLELAPGLTLRNRTVVSSLTRDRAGGEKDKNDGSQADACPNEYLAEYYRQRARGGFGLIMTEGTLIE